MTLLQAFLSEGFHLKGDKLLNELEGPPEDNDLCLGE